MARLKTVGVAWLLVAAVALLCARGEASAQAARVGREFKVKVGRTVTFGREGLRLKFEGVGEDSRCPAGVSCVWAGNAEVLIEVTLKGGRGKKTLTLNTHPSRQGAAEGKYGRYTVKLLGLSPQPRAERPLAQGEYTAALMVSKE